MGEHVKKGAGLRQEAEWIEQNLKIREILVNSPSSSEALGQIFKLRKELNKALSYAYLALKTEQKSRGHMADMINGKRSVHVKLAARMAQALDLEPIAVEYFVAKVSLDNAREEAERKKIRSELDRLAKVFAIHRGTYSEISFANLFFAFELFCALSLLGENCRYKTLLQHFGEENKLAVDQALAQLIQIGALEEAGGIIRQKQKHLSFVGQNRLMDAVNFIHESLRDTQRVLYRWFQRPKEALFDSTVISVRRAEFERMVPILRKELQKLKGDLENDAADELIRFNVQIYPLRRK